MGRSRYYSIAVLDVENWSSRPAVSAANIQGALRRIEDQGLAGAGIDPNRVGRQPRGDGAILTLPGDVAKELITARFVEALSEAVAEHDDVCDPEESIRIRLSLHAGDVIEGEGEWAGQPVVVASRLVDSAVIKRVLAASTGSPLALIVSRDWYDAVVKEGHISAEGYREVWVEEKTFADVAWVKVPGRTRPPGLLPEDDPGRHRDPGHGAGPPHGSRSGEASEYTVNYGNIVRASTIEGDIVFGNQYGGTSRSGGAER